MINFPQTKATREIEAEVVEKLKDYIPKNEEVGIKKVTEYIKAARDKRFRELPDHFKEVLVATNDADKDWLGFSYYYQRANDELGVGLFQLNKQYWKKNVETVEEPSPSISEDG